MLLDYRFDRQTKVLKNIPFSSFGCPIYSISGDKGTLRLIWQLVPLICKEVGSPAVPCSAWLAAVLAELSKPFFRQISYLYVPTHYR